MPFNASGKWIPDVEVPVMDVLGPNKASSPVPTVNTPSMPPSSPPTTPPAPSAPPGMEDDSVTSRLTGLLDSNSPYMTQARAAGTRTAARRGLLNSSVAAGSSEAAAIAAAAPIASQEASQVAQRNQARLEGSIQYDNSSRLQTQQDEAAMVRQLSGQEAQRELQRLDSEAQMLRQREAQGFQLTQQERDNLANMERLRESIASSDRQALLQAETSILNTQTSSRNDMTSSYLQAMSNLAANPKLKAADRNAYIAEFQRVTGQAATLRDTMGNVTINWGGNTPTPPPPAPTGGGNAPA